MRRLLARILTWSLIAITPLVSGCTGLPNTLPSLAISAREEPKSDEEYMQRLIELRRQARAAPGSTSLASELARLQKEAVDVYLAAGRKALEARRYAEAAQKFELGLVAEPSNAALAEGRMLALSRREAQRYEAQAARAKSVGNLDAASSLLERAANLDRGNATIRASLTTIADEQRKTEQRHVIKAFQSTALMDLNFKQAKLKDVLRQLGSPHHLSFVFDPEVPDAEVNISASRVTLVQAFNMALQASDTFHKIIGPNSLLIAPNTDDKRAKYADLYFKTFHLQTVKAEQMAQILTSAMELKTLVANKELNTIQVRETRETLDVVERLIAANDGKPAEIMLDVEIVEINRSKSEQLGIDYGSQITTSFPQFTIGALTQPPLAQAVLYEGLVTVPTLTLKYFKNDVDARILARPSIRTVDGYAAKIHIGDRVPLRSSTVQDATGQTRTTYEYRDVGIRLEVLPHYHFDETVSVALKLEVSALGQNLGTTNEPAFSIGTRNVDTAMMLREGETAVLGGLIRDEERRRWNKVPGLAELGLVGRLFSVNDDEDTRTDLLLTITPSIVRSQGLPGFRNNDFYSGRKGGFTTEKAFDYLKTVPDDELPRYNLTPDGNMETAATKGRAGPMRPAVQSPFLTTVARTSEPGAEGKLKLAFATPIYSIESGNTVTVDVLGANLPRVASLSTRVLFNPDKLTFEAAEPVSGSAGKVKATRSDRAGIVDLTITDIPAAANPEEAVVARLKLKGTGKGLSYLLINTAATPKGQNGEDIAIEFGASKVEVR